MSGLRLLSTVDLMSELRLLSGADLMSELRLLSGADLMSELILLSGVDLMFGLRLLSGADLWRGLLSSSRVGRTTGEERKQPTAGDRPKHQPKQEAEDNVQEARDSDLRRQLSWLGCWRY